MDVKSIGANNTNSQVKSASEKGQKKPIDNFTTVQYTSKKDGKTYVAKKLTLKENGKEVEGIYVYDKNAKPDEGGQVKGEFMSYETFMKNMADELPTVNSAQVKAYNPNFKSLSDEERFDKGFETGVKLSDGKILIRPCLLHVGSTNIQPAKEEGHYVVKYSQYVEKYKLDRPDKLLSEEQLVKDMDLCRGTIKKLDDGNYEVSYYENTHYSSPTPSTEMTTVIMDKEASMKFLKEKSCFL